MPLALKANDDRDRRFIHVLIELLSYTYLV